jgi:beta-galactosidase GanA
LCLQYSGWSAWLNGELIGSYLGNANLESGNLTITFPTGLVKQSGENVLLVVHDDTGHDEGALNPRGILQASLLSSSGTSLNFSRWRVAGTAGGESNLDPVRGVYNEDGFFAERVGWHLPGFDDSKWPSTSSASSTTGLSFTGAGVTFYRTIVPLNIRSGVDVSISFVFSAPNATNTAFRAQLFVNGYQYGRFNPYIGNQVLYPVPPGVLDYTGDNTIGLAVWSQTEAGAQITLDWQVNYVAESSLDVTFDGQALRPGWTEERLKYV